MVTLLKFLNSNPVSRPLASLISQNDQRRAAELFDELDLGCHGVISESQVQA